MRYIVEIERADGEGLPYFLSTCWGTRWARTWEEAEPFDSAEDAREAAEKAGLPEAGVDFRATVHFEDGRAAVERFTLEAS